MPEKIWALKKWDLLIYNNFLIMQSKFFIWITSSTLSFLIYFTFKIKYVFVTVQDDWRNPRASQNLLGSTWCKGYRKYGAWVKISQSDSRYLEFHSLLCHWWALWTFELHYCTLPQLLHVWKENNKCSCFLVWGTN